ncbi:MAG TPA: APC family permease [Polyangiaceae bacterium]|nr:APC family permease [Polyangiaceae bacterium]
MTTPTRTPAPAPEAAAASDSPGGPSLARTMGLGALVIYGVGDLLGAGIYGLVGEAAGRLGRAAWLGFLASALAALATGLSYASLGSRYPRAAGAAYVAERAFGRPWVAYLLGLATVAAGLSSTAAASRVLAGHLEGVAFGAPRAALAAAFVVALGALNFWGLRESTRVNALCTAAEAGGLVLIVAVGAKHWGSVDYLDAAAPANPGGALTPAALLGGAALSFYAFIGFEDLINVADEVKAPHRTLPRGIVIALVVTALMYTAVALTAVSILSPAELAASPKPLVDVAARAAPWLPPAAFTAVAVLAVTNTALLNSITGSRLLYGMARQGLLPRALGRVHAGRRTPHVAVGAVTAAALALALAGEVATLANATSVLLLAVFVTVNVALFRLQRRPGEPRGAFEVPAFVPAAGAAVCLALLAFAQRKALLGAAAVLAAIAVLYVVSPKRARPGAGEGGRQ